MGRKYKVAGRVSSVDIFRNSEYWMSSARKLGYSDSFLNNMTRSDMLKVKAKIEKGEK